MGGHDARRDDLALNGIENVELRAGGLFEPVAGEHFETPFAARDGVRAEASTVVRLADGLRFSAQVDGDLAELLVFAEDRAA